MAVIRQNQIAEVRAQITSARQLQEFANALPKHIPAERFARVIMTGIQNNPELLDCDRRSLLNACMRAAQDGLMPDGRLGALVIYKDKRRNTKMVQWLPMIAGLRQKVRNSGEIADWTANVVHEYDAWDYQEGDNPHIHHRPVRGDRGRIIAAYSIAHYRTGEVSREWMWIEELDKVRAVSKAERGPWQDWPEEMYKKTVAKRHAKVLPMSSDLDDLLRRPDEPESGSGKSNGATPLAVPDKSPPAALSDAMDALTHSATADRSHDEEIDGDGVVIDAGEYSASDDEQQLPLEDQEKAKRYAP